MTAFGVVLACAGCADDSAPAGGGGTGGEGSGGDGGQGGATPACQPSLEPIGTEQCSDPACNVAIETNNSPIYCTTSCIPENPKCPAGHECVMPPLGDVASCLVPCSAGCPAGLACGETLTPHCWPVAE